MSGVTLPKIEKYQKRQATLAGDEPVAFRVAYLGAGAATITIAAGAYTFQVGGANDVSVNPTGATPGVIGAAEATSVGAVVDLINADTDGKWKAWLVDSRRADLDTNIKALGATAVTAIGTDVVWDVSAAKAGILCIGSEAEPSAFGNAASRCNAATSSAATQPHITGTTLPLIPTRSPNAEKRYNRVSRIRRIIVNAGTDDASTSTVKVYRSTQSADVLLVALTPVADATDTIFTFGGNLALVSEPGERLVVAVESTHMDALTMTVEGDFGFAGNTDAE